MNALDEVVLYEAPLFAKARAIWKLWKGCVPTHPVKENMSERSGFGVEVVTFRL